MSDRATECPHCGCPIEFQIEETFKSQNLQPQQHKPRKTYKRLWLSLVVVGALAVFAGVFFLLGNSTFGKPTLKITPEFTKALERYDQIDAFSEGLAAVRRDGKWGYINLQGEEVIPCQFSDDFPPGQFSEGLACVVDDRNEADKELWNKRVGFINTKGEWVLTGDYFTESPNIGSVWEEVSHKLPSFKDGKCAVWNTGTQEVFDDNEIKLVDTKGTIHETPDSVGYKMIVYRPYLYTVPYKDIANTREEKKVYDDYAVTVARDTVECDNGARLVTWQILDVNNYPYQTNEKTIQYFIDNHGNSTLTSTQQKAMEQHLNGLMASLLDEHNEQLQRAAEEERQRREEEERQKQKEWLYGTWEYSGTRDMGVYLGGVKKVSATLIISEYNLRLYLNGVLSYNGSYEIHDNETIKYGSRNDLVIKFDSDSHRIEFERGKYFSKISSSSVDSYSSNNSSSYSSSNSKEMRWRNQLKSLTDEHNSLLDEFRTYQLRGQLDPMNAMWYKQRLLCIKDEQIGLAQNLGDYDLVREYQQKKLQLQQIFRSMGL
ncbi:MAG: WG repeat-containing protein [Muribaculaceae bacterium]|nr:WG repeat-containing protein [Muribaculaceae bacterium]